MALGFTELEARARDLNVQIERLETERTAAIDEVVTCRLQRTRMAGRGEDESRAEFELRVRQADSAVYSAEALAESISGFLGEKMAELMQVTQDLEAIHPKRLLELHPPAHTVDLVDIVELAGDLEPLLHMADQFVDDDTQAAEVRDAVKARADSLRGELRLYGNIGRDAVIITRTTAFLIATVTPQVVADLQDIDDADAAKAAKDLEAVQAGVAELGDDETAVDGAEAIIEAVAPELPGHPPTGLDGLVESPRWRDRGLDPALNRAGAIASIVSVGAGALESEKVAAVVRAAWALLRARFPWIFPH